MLIDQVSVVEKRLWRGSEFVKCSVARSRHGDVNARRDRRDQDFPPLGLAIVVVVSHDLS